MLAIEVARQAETGDATSRRTCRATNSDGLPCGAPPLQGQPWCYLHSPALAQQRLEDRRRGGQYHAAALLPTGIEVDLATTAGRLRASERLVNALLAGRIDPRRCATAVQAIAQMQSAFAAAVIEEQIDQLRRELAELREEQDGPGAA